MNVEETFEKVAGELFDIEEWTDDKSPWVQIWKDNLRFCFERIERVVPPESQGFKLTTQLMYLIPDLPQFIENAIEPFYRSSNGILFHNLRYRLDQNKRQARGTPQNIVWSWLRNTPLAKIFNAEVTITIPDDIRLLHTWFFAPTQTGKTTATKAMIEYDLARVAEGKASIVLLESKGELIEWLIHHEFFRDHPDKLIYIEPDHFVAVNPLERRSPRKTEKTYSRDLVSYVCEGILGSEFSWQHKHLFTNSFEVAWNEPAATFATLLYIAENGPDPLYRAALRKTDAEVQKYFAGQFKKIKSDRKDELQSRLWSVMSEEAFRKMLSVQKSNFNMLSAIDSGKVICIKATHSSLGDAKEAYGRFFIGLIEQAARYRSDPEQYRGPKTWTQFYIDEAHDYIAHDKKIGAILAQAAGQKIGLTIAHQGTDQLKEVIGALKDNVHIKIMRANDENALPTRLRYPGDPSDLPQHHFLLQISGLLRNRAVPVKFPKPKGDKPLSDDEFRELLGKVRFKKPEDKKPEPQQKRDQPKSPPTPENSDEAAPYSL